MSIDTEKIHRLRGKEFDTLYAHNEKKWKEMVRKAWDYARSIVPAAEPVRVGDVVEIVQNAIKIDPQFEEHFNKQKLTQKFWVPWYAEYIVEKTFLSRILRRHSMAIASDAKKLAQNFLKDQAAIIRKHGHNPKLSGPKFQRVMNDTRRTFENLRLFSAKITS